MEGTRREMNAFSFLLNLPSRIKAVEEQIELQKKAAAKVAEAGEGGTL
jgi:hypothetical protein